MERRSIWHWVMQKHIYIQMAQNKTLVKTTIRLGVVITVDGKDGKEGCERKNNYKTTARYTVV